MSGDLRSRLRQIQNSDFYARKSEYEELRTNRAAHNSSFADNGWEKAGHLTLKREMTALKGLRLACPVPKDTNIVISGIAGPGINGGTYEDLLFFDLETTGLSCGAGTVAFLAAFGRFIAAEGFTEGIYNLRIIQYLLLDYPGECDFVDAMLGEINRNRNVTIVSYNGKCFDSQILKTRCLMNGVSPPEYLHADLLYPARRLWKRLLPNCSQSTIETNIFGIDRSDDIPGSMAPEIWFSFLRNGNTLPLFGICDHNIKDITGLTSIFCAMISMAHDPIAAAEKIRYDAENLALRWFSLTRWEERADSAGEKLLCHVAKTGYPNLRAALKYGHYLLRTGKHSEGRDLLYKAAMEKECPAIQATALQSLSIDSERRLKNTTDALAFAEKGLALLTQHSSLRKSFECRIDRLKKMKKVAVSDALQG